MVIKYTLLAILSLFTLNSPMILNAQDTDNQDYMIILDKQIDLPNFRLIDAPYDETNTKDLPTREGLEGLKFSGSGQFSEDGLNELQKKLDQKDLIILDLRRECHGFLNGLAVSWEVKNEPWPNLTLDAEEIQLKEKELLLQALKTKNIFITKIVKDAQGQKEFIPISLTVTRESTERNLAAKIGIGYVRIPVSDHMRPLDKEVDSFLTFFKSIPDNSWTHIHCKGGRGRTNTFLIMVDMLHNAKNISFDTIMQRNMLISHTNFLIPTTPLSKQFIVQFTQRRDFLKDFYEYCKTNNDNYQTSWTNYLKTHT